MGGVYRQGAVAQAHSSRQRGAAAGRGHTAHFVGHRLDHQGRRLALVRITGVLQQVQGVAGIALVFAGGDGGADLRCVVGTGDGDARRLVDRGTLGVFDLVAHFDGSALIHGQAVEGRVGGVYRQGAVAQAHSSRHGRRAGTAVNFVGHRLDRQGRSLACILIAGVLQQVQGVEGITFVFIGGDGGTDLRCVVAVVDADGHGFFGHERGASSGVGGDDGEAVACLAFVIGTGLQGDRACGAGKVEQVHIPGIGLQAVNHRAVGRCAVGIAGGGGVDRRRGRCVFIYAAVTCTGKDRGHIIDIAHIDRERLSLDQVAIGGGHRHAVAAFGFIVRARPDEDQLAVFYLEVGDVTDRQHVVVATRVRVGHRQGADLYARADGDVFCNRVGRQLDGGGRFVDIAHIDRERLSLDQAAIGAGHRHAVVGRGLKVGAGANEDQLAVFYLEVGGVTHRQLVVGVAVLIGVVDAESTHLQPCSHRRVFVNAFLLRQGDGGQADIDAIDHGLDFAELVKFVGRCIFDFGVDLIQVVGIDPRHASFGVVVHAGCVTWLATAVVSDGINGVLGVTGLDRGFDQGDEKLIQACAATATAVGVDGLFGPIHHLGLGRVAQAGGGDIAVHRDREPSGELFNGCSGAAGLTIYARQSGKHGTILFAFAAVRRAVVSTAGGGDHAGANDVVNAKSLPHGLVDGCNVGNRRLGVFKSGQVGQWGDVDRGHTARHDRQGFKGG